MFFAWIFMCINLRFIGLISTIAWLCCSSTMKPTPWSACVSLPLHVYTKLLSICFDPNSFVLLSEIPSTAIFLFFMISTISGMWSPNPVTFHVAILSLLLLFLFPFPFSSQCPFPCPFPCSFPCPFPVISVRLYIPWLSVAWYSRWWLARPIPPP